MTRTRDNLFVILSSLENAIDRLSSPFVFTWKFYAFGYIYIYDAPVKFCKLYQYFTDASYIYIYMYIYIYRCMYIYIYISKSIEFPSEAKMGRQQVDRDDNRVVPRTVKGITFRLILLLLCRGSGSWSGVEDTWSSIWCTIAGPPLD
jgi:hypothetical protein